MSIKETIGLSDSFKWETQREFYEKNVPVLVIVAVIAVVSPFLGLLVAGLPGVAVGFVLSLVSYFLAPVAVTKVREIRSGG